MAEIDARILAKLEQIRGQQAEKLDKLLVEQHVLGTAQEDLLNYMIDILRDIRMGLSMALGEDLNNYSTRQEETT